jgi:hypothetical protein
VLALSAATGTLGCKKLLALKRKGAVDAGKPVATSTNTPQDDADEQLQDKLDAYVICLNTLSSPVHATRSRYFSWVNPKTGPTGNERVILGLFDLPKDSAQKCTAGLAKAKLLPPPDAKLEAAGNEFARTVMDLDTLIDDVFTYYENRNFKDDKFAKGKAMHPRLMAAFAAFSRADTNLHTTLDAITTPLSQRMLARVEREEGKKFRYHRRHVLLAARELVEAGNPIGEDDDIDFALYNASFAELDKALTELQLFGALHKNELDAQDEPGVASGEVELRSVRSFGRDLPEEGARVPAMPPRRPDEGQDPVGQGRRREDGRMPGRATARRPGQVQRAHPNLERPPVSLSPSPRGAPWDRRARGDKRRKAASREGRGLSRLRNGALFSASSTGSACGRRADRTSCAPSCGRRGSGSLRA